MWPNPLLKFATLGLGVIALPVIAGAVIGKLTETTQTVKPIEQIALTASGAQSNQATQPTIPEVVATKSSAPTASDAKSTNQQVAGATTPATDSAKPAPPAPAEPTCSGDMAQKFLCLLNDYRAQHGLGKVGMNTTLSQVALAHSTWMNQTGTFSHTGLNSSRLTERCQAASTTCLAENLAHKISSPEELLSSWSANAGHNQNLLGPYSLIGFGAAGSYITLLFR